MVRSCYIEEPLMDFAVVDANRWHYLPIIIYTRRCPERCYSAVVYEALSELNHLICLFGGLIAIFFGLSKGRYFAC